ncbi:DUF3955 domain-containing protein [uncultured Maritalea sp.]|jgi:hypothetical protein|uniref:DUF3955 domain-containing protein n=1 Tax=uncultured Maritalea sp. TaxID=757249 RepID=UPI00262CD2A5|nr:DUF3955 domain-containing protein [uncultured Maritalea sp.]
MRHPLLLTSFILFGLAAICIFAESTFYGGIDENGVLQESLFLPLTFIFAAGGIVFLAIFGLRKLFKK